MSTILDREQDFRNIAEASGQGHLFAWWPDLNRSQRTHLLQQIASIDFQMMASLVHTLLLNPEHTGPVDLHPAPIIPIPRTDEEKITFFEETGIPVDGYGVGSSLFKGRIDFTAGVVKVNGNECAKEGLSYIPNPRLTRF